MADISVTAASVLASGNSQIETGRAGEGVTAGQVVYKEAATGLFKLADCDSVTAAVKVPYGIALHASLTGQPLSVLTAGDLTLNAALTGGTPYYLSETPGGIRATPDTGDSVALLGIAKSTTVLAVRIVVPGVTL